MACKPLMCWSTGRLPMAQPPGSDTLASPKRASVGPSTRIEARMVFTSSYGACRVWMSLAVSSYSCTLSVITRAPMPCSSFCVVSTSRSCGTLVSRRVSAVSRLAHKIGSAAFLAPDTVMSPFSGPLPTIFSFSMTSIQPLQRATARNSRAGNKRGDGVAQRSGFLRPLFWRQRLGNRQRVQLVAVQLGAGDVHHQTMAFDQALARKSRRDNHRKKVMAIAFHVHVGAVQLSGNQGFYLFGGQHQQSLFFNS